jgi:lipopolysaccharide biosynthesis glycosyltransferase
MKYCVFTICAKNYLAQTLTLKESLEKHNPSVDFYIFLADLCDDEIISKISNLIMLDKKIIPKWEEMAFKYTVLEFSVSLKPFCAGYLLEKYEKIIYLDSDIYVTSSLGIIFDWLDNKDVILTPHCNHITPEYTGAVEEDILSFVGIYNAGFFAVRNSRKGFEIITWWMNRLENKCYVDRQTAQHVDQRWLDFLPACFPDDVLITHHQGCNVAIWNLHERELIYQDNKYYIRDKMLNNVEDLLFFHFSGFDPFNKNVINRRHPQYNTTVFPSFIPLIEEYIAKIYANNYNYYSKLKYSFNHFSNGKLILPINRRICRTLLDDNYIEHPFSSESPLYKGFKESRLISSKKNIYSGNIFDNIEYKNKKMKILYFFFKIIFYLFGIDKYSHFLNVIQRLARYENQTFLYRNAQGLDRRFICQYQK